MKILPTIKPVRISTVDSDDAGGGGNPSRAVNDCFGLSPAVNKGDHGSKELTALEHPF